MAAKQAKSAQRSRAVWIGVSGTAALVLVVAGVLALLQHPPPAPSVPDPHADYVGSNACVGCHKDIADKYQTSAMGRSLYRPTAKNVVEDFDHAHTLDHQPSGFRYTMHETKGDYFVRRSEIGFDGKEANVLDEKIDYVIGSGDHARTYLHRSKDGQLMELPVSWYPEHGGTWAMSPGYEGKDQPDMRRAISPECMFCHNTYPSYDAGLERSMFPNALPEGIDCERCHGPGRAHVAAAAARHPKPDLVRSSIVNPAKLNRDRQLEVCLQCHLDLGSHNANDASPNGQRLFDRTIFSYVPGQPLADYKLYFQPMGSEIDDSFNIAQAGYRLRKSACFRNSQMTCSTCHDPHGSATGEQAVAHYVAVCQSCHSTITHTVALPAGSTCLSCHMPKRRTDDVVHAIATDHFIRRTQPGRDLLAPIPEPIAPKHPATKMVLYYPSALSQTPAAEVAEAEAQVDDNGIDRLRTLLERYNPNRPEPYVALAEAYGRGGNKADVARWSEEALVKQASFRPAILDLLPEMYAMRAAETLGKAVERYPEDDLLLADLGQAYFNLGQIAEAGDTVKGATNQDPERAISHNLLGIVRLKQTQLDAAEKEFREALRYDPTMADAQEYLGAMLTEEHTYPEAQFYLQKVISANPDSAQAHRDMGRLQQLMGQNTRALSELREAVRLAPNDLRIRASLADGLAAAGQSEDANVEYGQILDIDQKQPQANLGLALVLLAQHKPNDARPHLQAAAHGTDAELASKAAQLLKQLPQ